MDYIILLLVLTVSVWLTAGLLPGAHIDNIYAAIPVAIVLSFFNFLVKPVLIFLTIPITIITFGLFIFVINGLIIWWVSKFFQRFSIKSFGWAILFSFLLSIIQSVLDTIIA
jgi:putative membrane protein